MSLNEILEREADVEALQEGTENGRFDIEEIVNFAIELNLSEAELTPIFKVLDEKGKLQEAIEFADQENKKTPKKKAQPFLTKAANYVKNKARDVKQGVQLATEPALKRIKQEVQPAVDVAKQAGRAIKKAAPVVGQKVKKAAPVVGQKAKEVGKKGLKAAGTAALKGTEAAAKGIGFAGRLAKTFGKGVQAGYTGDDTKLQQYKQGYKTNVKNSGKQQSQQTQKPQQTQQGPGQGFRTDIHGKNTAKEKAQVLNNIFAKWFPQDAEAQKLVKSLLQKVTKPV